MKWKIIPLILIAVLFFAAISSPATAQDDEEAEDAATVVELTGATGSLNIKQEVQTQAKVELVVGDQLYQLTVPVTVQIDTTRPLTDATVAVPVTR